MSVHSQKWWPISNNSKLVSTSGLAVLEKLTNFLYFGSCWMWIRPEHNSSWTQSWAALSAEKGSRICCYCWQPNHQKSSSSPLVNQWLILPRGASLTTWKLCWTILGSVMWSSFVSHERIWCLHIIYYASLCLDVSQSYCLKSPAIACGRQNGCCVKFISVQ